MVITWSDISVSLGQWAIGTNAFSLVVGGSLITFLKNWMVNPETAEREMKTLKSGLSIQMVDSYRRLLNWHARNVLECAENEFLSTFADPVQSHVNELLRSIVLMKRIDRIYHRARLIHGFIFFFTIASLSSFIIALLIPLTRPWAGGVSLFIVFFELILVNGSRSCKAQLEEASETI